MKHITVMRAEDIIALVNRIAVNGTVEVGQFATGVQMLEKTNISEETIFDRADQEHGRGRSGWPEMGRWEPRD